MNRSIGTLAILFLLTLQSYGGKNQNSPKDPVFIFQLMKRVADWQWRNLEKGGWKNHKKDWTSGTLYSGMMAWGSIANDERVSS